MRPILRNQLCAAGLILGSAVVRLPVETAVTEDLLAQKLLPAKLDTSLRDEMSQETFVAAAGGLRSLIASYYEVEAFIAFHQQPSRWDQVDKYYTLCCQLQPRTTHYWNMYGWMLSKNAAMSYATEGEATTGREEQMLLYYRDKGLAVLLRGIAHNPDSYVLYRQAAFLYGELNPQINPRPDHAKAAALFLRGSKCSDATRPPGNTAKYLYRFHLYELSRVPGQEMRAYDGLLTLYRSGPDEDFPTTITSIKRLEEKLGVPIMYRIDAAGKKPEPYRIPSYYLAPPPFLPLAKPHENKLPPLTYGIPSARRRPVH